MELVIWSQCLSKYSYASFTIKVKGGNQKHSFLHGASRQACFHAEAQGENAEAHVFLRIIFDGLMSLHEISGAFPILSFAHNFVF